MQHTVSIQLFVKEACSQYREQSINLCICVFNGGIITFIKIHVLDVLRNVKQKRALAACVYSNELSSV